MLHQNLSLPFIFNYHESLYFRPDTLVQQMEIVPSILATNTNISPLNVLFTFRKSCIAQFTSLREIIYRIRKYLKT